jgi:hypothetical protein
LKLKFSIDVFTNMILIPLFNQDGTVDEYSTSYQISLNFDVKPCEEGEELSKAAGICIPCALGKYNLNSGDMCLKCVRILMEECYGNTIKVSQGYWRKSNKTDIITYCSNMPSNCLGGNENYTCMTGYAGALCEVCDLYGEYGDKYSNTVEFNCLPCS